MQNNTIIPRWFGSPKARHVATDNNLAFFFQCDPVNGLHQPEEA